MKRVRMVKLFRVVREERVQVTFYVEATSALKARRTLTPDFAVRQLHGTTVGVAQEQDAFPAPRLAAEIYLDISLKRIPTVFPACGSANSLIELSCGELFLMARARDWVDVCKDWRQGDNNEDHHME